MAKKPIGEETVEEGERRITPEIQKKIDDLIYQKKRMDLDKEAYSEQAEAIAASLGIKKAVLTRRVDLIVKEETKGGEVKQKEQDIEFVEQYFNVKSNNEHK